MNIREQKDDDNDSFALIPPKRRLQRRLLNSNDIKSSGHASSSQDYWIQISVYSETNLWTRYHLGQISHHANSHYNNRLVGKRTHARTPSDIREYLRSLREFKNTIINSWHDAIVFLVKLLHTVTNRWRSCSDLSMSKYFNPPRALQTERRNRFENNKHPGVNLTMRFCMARFRACKIPAWRA